MLTVTFPFSKFDHVYDNHHVQEKQAMLHKQKALRM